VRVICWNTRRARAESAVWRYLLDLAPDLALLQEVSSLPDLVQRHYAIRAEFAAGPAATTQKFRTVLLVRGRLGPPVSLRGAADWVSAELDRFAGNLVASEVVPDAGPPLKAVSVYSPAWPVARSRLTGIDVSEVRLTQNQDVWVGDLLWAALRAQALAGAEDWVIAGDFNLSETFDEGRGGPRGNREYLDRMADLGLVECLRESRGALTPTFRNTDQKTILHQIDHLFVTRGLSGRLISCDTGPRDIVFGANLSDHLPLIADFDL
jgi:exonuclease III